MRFQFGLILILLGSVTTRADHEDVLKQKFFYEILQRVQDPLQFVEWINYGKTLDIDQSNYKNYDHWMDKFYVSYQRGSLLPKGQFFGELVRSHMQEAKGLFHFFCYANNWDTFQQNVCWARMHVNEGLFVYALHLGAYHCYSYIRTPPIYEIFPQHFFNSKFIQTAERFNYDAWEIYEKEVNGYNNREPIQTWQWWKKMGSAQRLYTQHHTHYNLWGNKKNFTVFFMPVDYTRDIKILNIHSKMSYFTEDVEWCNDWYRFNMQTSVLLPLEHRSQQDRSLMWLHKLQQLLARYNLERLANGLGEIEDLSRSAIIMTGYNPQMVSWNGLPFFQRANNFDYKELSNGKNFQQLAEIRDKILHTFKEGDFVRIANGSVIEMKSSDGYKHFAQLLHGDADVVDENFSYSFLFSVMMFNSQMDFDQFYGVEPNVLLNYETMFRDPLAYIIFKTQFLDYLRQYQQTLEPYNREQFLLDGVEIVDVKFSDIVTKFRLFDVDVSNLLVENMTSVNDGYQRKNILLAFQKRLGHKEFTFNVTVESDAAHHEASIHLFIGPKYDEHGEVIKLNENRFNFVELIVFPWDLANGTNDRMFTFDYDFIHTLNTERLFNTAKYSQLKTLPRFRRGTLPKGTTDGFPLQMFMIILDWNINNMDMSPFDREIDESEFFVPNMFLEEVKVFHEDD